MLGGRFGRQRTLANRIATITLAGAFVITIARFRPSKVAVLFFSAKQSSSRQQGGACSGNKNEHKLSEHSRGLEHPGKNPGKSCGQSWCSLGFKGREQNFQGRERNFRPPTRSRGRPQTRTGRSPDLKS